MQLDYTLWLYILIFATILFILLRSGGEFGHALFLALIISFAFLLFAKQPNDVNMESDNISCVFIYYAIIFINIIAILIYGGVMAYKNLYKKK